MVEVHAARLTGCGEPTPRRAARQRVARIVRGASRAAVLAAAASVWAAGPGALAGPASPAAPADPADPASPPGEDVAVIETSLGEIVWRFFPGEAPEHVAYVRELIRTGFYDGTTFHRVIPHFVIQGGDPNSRNDDRSDDGEGEADRRLAAEFSERMHYRPGTVGMAREVDPDSGSCQFFIALEDLPRLDGKYTIFGEVVAGLDVARRIARVPRDLKDNPLAPVRISARLDRRVLPDALAGPEGIASLSPGAGSGEVLTGPSRPRPYDPGDVHWSAPALTDLSLEPGEDPNGTAGHDFASRRERGDRRGKGERDERRGKGRRGEPSPGPLEVTVGVDGVVIDVRFPDLETPDAEVVRARLLQTTFRPAEFRGAPVKTRFVWDPASGAATAPAAPGDPLLPSPDLVAPRPLLVIELPEGTEAPAAPAVLRLLVGADGGVLSVSLQQGTGDETLDTAATERAAAMRFSPARRVPPEDSAGPGEAVASYLEVRAVFEPSP